MIAGGKAFVTQLIRNLRLLISPCPNLYRIYADYCQLSFRLTNTTTVVVDSYPRCGNSFFEAAFNMAQKGREVVAHHSHAAGQVLAGVKKGLPCIVLIREPEAAISSFYEMSEGKYSIQLLTREFVTFYSSLLPVIDKLIIVETSMMEARFRNLMVHLHDQYGLKVEPYEIDTAMRAQLFRVVDEVGRQRNGFVAERYSDSLNSAEKQARRRKLDAIRAMVGASENANNLRRAQALYKAFKSHAF